MQFGSEKIKQFMLKVQNVGQLCLELMSGIQNA